MTKTKGQGIFFKGWRCMCAAALYFLAAAAPAGIYGAVSSGGGYSLEYSVRDSGGGGTLRAGDYSARASAGQTVMPAGLGNSSSGAYANRSGFYNPPHFTFQKNLPAVIKADPVSAGLTIPAGAVDKEVFDITLNNDPAAQPLSVDPGLINSANSKIERNEGAWARLFPSHITEMSLFDEQSAWDRPLLKSGTLSMRYKDEDGDGILDGSNPPVRVETVKAWALDEQLGMWAKLPDASFDRGAKTISVPFMAPGVYSLLGMLDESVKDTYAFPVPFRPHGPNAGAGAGRSGAEAEGITFTNVPQTGDIEIYTLDGRLVRKLPIPSGLVIPSIKWDVRTAGGERAASGVYIWRVVSGPNSKAGKLMVIW